MNNSNDPWMNWEETSPQGIQESSELSLYFEAFSYFPNGIGMTTGKLKQSIARLLTSVCTMVGKFGAIALCLKIVRCLQRKEGGGSDSEIGRWGWGRGRLCCIQTLHGSAQVRKRIAAEGAQCRDVRLCCSMLTTVGNEGAWLLPSRHWGQGHPRRLLLIEMEIQEVMLQREEVSCSPCQSVCLFILWCFITVTLCAY